MVTTLAALYLVSQFLRNSVGVIAPDLRAAEMGLKPIELGLLSSIYFFAFAFGLRSRSAWRWTGFGPEALHAALAVGFTVLGCALFAAAQSSGSLTMARALQGFGTACS